MSIFSKSANAGWHQFKDLLGLGKFLSYDGYETYILVVFTMVLTMKREYGSKVARLGLEWFGLDNEDSIAEYRKILDGDRFLVDGDRVSIINQIMRVPLKGDDVDNFEDYLSSSQWFGAMIFVNKSYLTRDLGSVDDSALFPTNITRERVESYLANPTKLPIFQKSVKFVEGIPFIGSRAMKLHLISMITSLMWYSNNPSWRSEHESMWVRGDNTKFWLERRARLNLNKGQPFNKAGIF